MAYSEYAIPEHVKGDTFEGVQFTVTVNSVALNLTGSSIKMDLRPAHAPSTLVKRLALGSGLTLVTPASGIFKIDKQVIDISAGDYVYDIQITLASGDIKSYIRGSWSIVQDRTYS